MTRIAFDPTRIVAPTGFICPKRRCATSSSMKCHLVAVELGAREPSPAEQCAALDFQVVLVGAEDAE
jgi:hypothetical protein